MQDIPSLSAQFLPATDGSPSGPSSPSPGSNEPSLLRNVVTFCSFAILAMVVTTAALWLIRREPNPNASADMFLWFAGQNKTWGEYQEGQKAAGRGRLDEKEFDWTQQLINDAYSR